MRKYTPAQLGRMAAHALEAKRAGDHRYLMLIVRLADITGLSGSECERRIVAMADAKT